ncbi:MAG TPA: hypothetical protein VI541_03715, partial [Actinomycetota bacterium]|nr:hypothetical protein [Actinomycetota bacterium]
MKVLSVVSSLPYPPDDGTRSTAWNFIRALNSIADVTVCTWVTGKEDPDHIAQVRSAVKELITLADRGGRPTWPERIEFRARSLMLRVPPYILEKRDRCDPMPELDGFDLAVAEEDAALMLMPPFRCPVVVHRHNIFPDTIRTLRSSGALGTARKLKWISEMPMWRRYNRELSEKATVSIATTPEAAESLRRVLPGVDVFVVCNGVKIPEEQLIPGPQPRGIFTGVMDYEPNADAATSFVRDLWPRIVSEVPDASFQIIGRNPLKKVLRLSGQGVDVVGGVPD